MSSRRTRPPSSAAAVTATGVSRKRKTPAASSGPAADAAANSGDAEATAPVDNSSKPKKPRKKLTPTDVSAASATALVSIPPTETQLDEAFDELLSLAEGSGIADIPQQETLEKWQFLLIFRFAQCIASAKQKCPNGVFIAIKQQIVKLIDSNPLLVRQLFFLVCGSGADVKFRKDKSFRTGRKVQEKDATLVPDKDKAKQHSTRQMCQVQKVFSLVDTSADDESNVMNNMPDVRNALKKLSSEVEFSLPMLTENATPSQARKHALIIRDVYGRVLDTLIEITQNVMESPVNPQHLRVNLANAADRGKFAQFEGAIDYLRFLGFAEDASVTSPNAAGDPQQLIILPESMLITEQVKLKRALTIIKQHRPPKETLSFYLEQLLDNKCPSAFIAAVTRCFQFRGASTPETFPIDAILAVYTCVVKYDKSALPPPDPKKPDSIDIPRMILWVHASSVVDKKWIVIRIELVPLLDAVFVQYRILVPPTPDLRSFDDYFRCVYRYNQQKDANLHEKLRSRDSAQVDPSSQLDSPTSETAVSTNDSPMMQDAVSCGVPGAFREATAPETPHQDKSDPSTGSRHPDEQEAHSPRFGGADLTLTEFIHHRYPEEMSASGALLSSHPDQLNIIEHSNKDASSLPASSGHSNTCSEAPAQVISHPQQGQKRKFSGDDDPCNRIVTSTSMRMNDPSRLVFSSPLLPTPPTSPQVSNSSMSN